MAYQWCNFHHLAQSASESRKHERSDQILWWAFANGGAMATELEYVPMPADVIKLIHSGWKANLKDASGKALY